MTRSARFKRIFKSRVKSFTPYLALSGAAFFWSGNFIVGRALREDVSPIALNFWRWAIALTVLLPFTARQASRHSKQLKAEWKRIMVLGFTGIAGFHICVYAALQNTTAINALLLFCTSPLIIMTLSWILRIEVISRLQMSGVVISLFGVAVLITRGELRQLWQWHFGNGDLWMVVGVAIWAVYSILLKQRPAGLTQPVLLLATIVAGILIMLPFYLGYVWVGHRFELDTTGFCALVYIGIFASVLAFLFWNFGVMRLGPGKAGLFIHLMPVFGTFLSIVMLDEGLAPYLITGAAFVFTGVVLCSIKTAQVVKPRHGYSRENISAKKREKPTTLMEIDGDQSLETFFKKHKRLPF